MKGWQDAFMAMAFPLALLIIAVYVLYEVMRFTA